MKSEWNIGTISEVCSLVTDGSHYSPKSCDNGEYMVSVKDFKGFGFDFSNCKHISSSDYEKMKASGCIPECGDILIGKDGARFFEDIIIYNQPEKPALLSSIAILRCNSDIILPQFLYYICKNPVFKKDVRDNYGSGSAIPRIVLKDFKRMPISYPDLDEQRRIVASLVAIDDRILLNTTINENLEQQAQAIFSNLFPKCMSNGIAMSNIIDVRDGTHDSPKAKKEGYSLITSKHLQAYSVNKKEANLISYEDFNKINERSKVEYGDILISMIGTVGIISFISDKSIDFAIKNVGLFRTSQSAKLRFYVLNYLKTNEVANYIEQHLAGSTQKYISLTELRNLPIRIPSDEDLQEYNELISPIYGQIITLSKENQWLTELRDTLLPKLMNGEIDVSKVKI